MLDVVKLCLGCPKGNLVDENSPQEQKFFNLSTGLKYLLLSLPMEGLHNKMHTFYLVPNTEAAMYIQLLYLLGF